MRPTKAKIYPILVVHDRSFSVLGLNNILNNWFDDELQKLKNSGYCIERIRSLVLIDFDTLIYFSQEIKLPKNVFHEILNDYLKRIDRSKLGKKGEVDNFQKLLNINIPFSNYVYKKLRSRSIEPINLIKDLKKYLQ